MRAEPGWIQRSPSWVSLAHSPCPVPVCAQHSKCLMVPVVGPGSAQSWGATGERSPRGSLLLLSYSGTWLLLQPRAVAMQLCLFKAALQGVGVCQPLLCCLAPAEQEAEAEG